MNSSSEPTSKLKSLARRPGVWTYAALLTLGLLLTIPVTLGMFSPPQIAAAAWLGGAGQALLLLGVAWLMLPRYRSSYWLLLAAILIGAAFSAGIVPILNSEGSTVLAPLIEEPAKLIGAAAALSLISPRNRGPVLGLIVGFFVGFGFEIIEDITYTFNSGVEHGDAGQAWMTVLGRSFVGFGLHSMWTAITTAALAFALVRKGGGWSVLSGALALSIVLHMAWDNPFEVGLPLGDDASVVLGIVIMAMAYLASAGGFLMARRLSTAAERDQAKALAPFLPER